MVDFQTSITTGCNIAAQEGFLPCDTPALTQHFIPPHLATMGLQLPAVRGRHSLQKFYLRRINSEDLGKST